VTAAPTLSRDVARSRRKRAVASHTFRARETTKRELAVLRAQADYDLEAAGDFVSPEVRGDCALVSRPCPHVSCRHSLYLDVNAARGVKMNFPDLEPGELPANGSCSLDVAERGGATIEMVGELLNLTRERVRQIETVALAKLEPLVRAFLRDVDAAPHRHLPMLQLPSNDPLDVSDGFDVGHERLADRVGA
jgi:hypothetical protein